MTTLRIFADPARPDLSTALASAPWRQAAGITVTADGAESQLVFLGPRDSWSNWTESALERGIDLTQPTVVVGRGDSELDSPIHDIRVRAQGLGVPEDFIITDRVMRLPTELPSDSELVTANIGFHDYTVAAGPVDAVWVALGLGSRPQTWLDADFLRMIHRLLHLVRGRASMQSVRVGLLGYGAIGHEHAEAITRVTGLDLAVVCDTQESRLAAAQEFSPQISTTPTPTNLIESSDVDLIVVSTPPNTHAQWALTALNAGKHVVLEKPMALTTAECDEVVATAASLGKLAVVYQNRRFDPDFLALKQVIDDGELGDVFHLESFVGTHQHPCNYWHSDRDVSGGALFDWGSHVVDQVLQLMPGQVQYVTAVNHKRRWHDVTNADHSRMTLHYDDGREASFVYSDLAAAMKPRWYILGTRGGVIGDWRHERVIARSAVGTLAEDRLAAADSPPDLTLFSEDGRVTQLPGIQPKPFTFHTELSAYFSHGLPMQVSADQSRRTVAMLEAAEESALNNGQPATPR